MKIVPKNQGKLSFISSKKKSTKMMSNIKLPNPTFAIFLSIFIVDGRATTEEETSIAI